MLANPEMVGGRHDRLDTSLMKAAPDRLVSKAGMEALRGIAILPGPRTGTSDAEASGLAVKIEDGDGYDRGTWAASVEALRQAGVLDGGRAAVARPLPPAAGPRPARTRRRRGGRRVRARAGGRADRLRPTGRGPARSANLHGPDRRPVSHARAARGATLDEVKRAYRRLAKATTPTPPARRRCRGSSRSRPPTSSSSTTGTPTAVARRRRAAAPIVGATPARADADAPRRVAAGRDGRARPGGRRTSASGRRQRPRAGAARPAGTAGPPAPAHRPADRAPTRPGRRGTAGPNKATLGSTSYDGADGEPFEPDWGGASWYGTTSGTYWTINPKEYADPRKHGPEYQARARRAAGGPRGARRRPAAADAEPDRRHGSPTRPGEHRRRRRTSRPPRPTPTHTTPSWWDSTHVATGGRSLGRGERPRRRPIPARRRADAAPHATAAAERRDADAAAARPRPRRPTDLGRALTDERAARGRWRARPGARRLAADRPRARLAGRRDHRLRPLRRDAATARPAAAPAGRRARASSALLLLVPARGRSRPRAAVAAVVAAVAGRARPVGDRRGRRRRVAAAQRPRRGPARGRVAGRRRRSPSSAAPQVDAVEGRSRILSACHRRHDPQRPVGRRPAIPARAAGHGRLRRRRPRHRRAGRAPPRRDHPGRQRDVPPARGRRARRPRRGPRAPPDAGRAGRPPTASSGATRCSSGC